MFDMNAYVCACMQACCCGMVLLHLLHFFFLLLQTAVSSVSTVTLKIELHVSSASATLRLDKASYETQVSHNMKHVQLTDFSSMCCMWGKNSVSWISGLLRLFNTVFMLHYLLSYYFDIKKGTFHHFCTSNSVQCRAVKTLVRHQDQRK